LTSRSRSPYPTLFRSSRERSRVVTPPKALPLEGEGWVGVLLRRRRRAACAPLPHPYPSPSGRGARAQRCWNLKDETMDKDLYDKGMKIRREVLGDAYVDRALAKSGPFNDPLQELVTTYCWGWNWGREGLPRRD